MIVGPTIIGRNCRIRHNAYIREHVIIGDDCVVGNSSAVKHSLLFHGAQVPHFNYVGDSILGYRAHLGAGVILSNVRLDKAPVTVHGPGGRLPTTLRKFGAIVGDRAEIGCNSVLSPGSLVGHDAVIYPGSQWRGYLPAGHIAKLEQTFQIVPGNR
jgi:NDP-sugar pyrophosphorylase family protein